MGPHAWRREGQGGPGRGTTLISCWEGAELPGSVVWKNVPIPTPAGGHALRQSICLDFSPPDSQDWLLSLGISQGNSLLALPVRSRVGRLGKAAEAFGGRRAQGRHAGQVGQVDHSTAVPYRVGAGGTSPPLVPAPFHLSGCDPVRSWLLRGRFACCCLPAFPSCRQGCRLPRQEMIPLCLEPCRASTTC